MSVWRSVVRRRIEGVNLLMFLAVWSALLIPPLCYWLGPLNPFPVSRYVTVVTMVVSTYSAGLTCIFAFALAWFVPLRRGRYPYVAASYVIGAYLLARLNTTVQAGLYPMFRLSDEDLGPGVVPRLSVMIVIIANMIIAGNAIRAAVRTAGRERALVDLERKLAEVQLFSVQRALDPDDAFASLDSIRDKIADDPDAALEAMAEMGDRLRQRIADARMTRG